MLAMQTNNLTKKQTNQTCPIHIKRPKEKRNSVG